MENTIDATGEEDENEELEEAPMGNDEHQENEIEDTGRDGDTCEPHTDYEAEDNNNDISSAMDKQYGTRTRENMRARNQKCDLPLKLSMHPKINSEAKRSKILHASTMVQTMGNTHLDLRDYALLHATIHCRTNPQENVMRNLLVTAILTQCHVSKRLKVFGDPGVAAVL